jgi:peptidoglycan/LPS O-acetylase OafA/YrhL
MQATSLDAYRPDIDGLRAIAVLAVIAFHASSRIVPGGFAGVDIFFVISGYLISGLIFKGIQNGSFSFADFYTRRIKRIFPAYIVVALATLVFASYLLIPNDYIFYTTSLAASWGFASNIFFSMLSWGYFGQRTEEFPLLHTWSLSVEEQFYFIFPILLIFLFRYFRKHLVVSLIFLGIIFTTISELKTGEIKSYFLLTSRAHELIIGALTFFAVQKFPIKSRHVSDVLAVSGMTLMLGSLFLLNQGLLFPGINSLYPCMGVALLLYACHTENVITPILKNKLFVSIGLISYSLYLWHWPIFSFLKYRKIDITFWVGISAVALSFVLAFMTWKFVENPIRRNRQMRFKKAFVQIYLIPAIAFFSIGLYSYLTEGAPQRFPEETRQLISSYSYARDLGRLCSIRAEDYKKITLNYLLDHCAFGDLSQQKAQVLLLGDSHADHFKPFVDQLSKNAKLKSVFHVQGGCFPTTLQDADMKAEPSTCQKRNSDLLEIAGNFKFVVLAGFWSSEKDEHFEKKLEYVVEKISKAGATPVIFKDNPSYEPDLSRCILFKKRGWISADSNCNIPYSSVADNQASIDKIIDRVKLKYPQALIIDPKRVMCDSSECVTHIANTALYKDWNHINTKAAQLLGERYISHEGNPFSRDHITGSDSQAAGTGLQQRTNLMLK